MIAMLQQACCTKLEADLSCHLSNAVQPVHHVVQQLQLFFREAAEEEGPGSSARLDDVWNILQHNLDFQHNHIAC